MLIVPDDLVRTITDVHGEAGVAWLERLPALAADCSERWGLTIEPPFGPLSYHYVAPALLADATPVVLKLGVPDHEFGAQAESLRLFDGRGIVRLIDADVEAGALLLERLTPGSSLEDVEDDDEATTVGAAVLRELWRDAPPVHSFPTVGDWAGGLERMRHHFGGGTGPLPEPFVARAESLFAELLATTDDAKLLHGDLHHGNVLRAQRRAWLALDPKGVVGEPAYDAAVLLRSVSRRLMAEARPDRVLARRADRLAEELGFDRERLLAWALAQAVLGAWWSVEDHGHGWEWGIAEARLMAEVTRDGSGS